MNVAAEQALFDACAGADGERREHLLAACGDAALAVRVRKLLAIHDRGATALDAGLQSISPLAMPKRVGPYAVLQRLGEGAMGEVYLAEQQQPVRRRVAVKVLKFGLSTREVIARFDLERQALAMLAHPNIARILDAGSTDDGRPYFAMEYVDGTPITRHCEERGLDLKARLALFTEVCAGVQHAHLRGIIHRDLKPSNILVAEQDGQPAPRIIDFGIAKATASGGPDTIAQTRFGHLLGTPEYMSPEQAQLAPLDIDLRTDVYSLGVVLYELLTGQRPYVVTRGALSSEQLAREIGEGEARRPSDCVTGERARMLSGDLDWIVLRAIEKERTRRYSSVQALADDLERHARSEPVLAGPPSWSYRAERFVRRHRLAVALTASLFAAVLVFGSAMAWLARENARERDRANAEAQIARRVTEFTAGLFGFASPEASNRSEISARELLDAGIEEIERGGLATEPPEVRAALLEAAGDAYRGIGELERSSELLEEAVAIRRERAESDPMALGRVLMRESLLRLDQGRFQDSANRAREAITLFDAADIAGDDSAREAMSRARVELAETLRRDGQLDEAKRHVSEAMADFEKRAPGSENHVGAVSMLGRLYAAEGRFAEAEPLLRHAYDMQVKLSGPDSFDAVNARNGLADYLVTAGKTDEAEVLLRRNVASARHIYGDKHAMTGITWNNLGNALSDIPARYAEAEKAYLESVRIFEQALGPRHVEVGTAYNNLGALYISMERWPEAAGAYRKSVEIRSETLGAGNVSTLATRVGLARAMARTGQPAEAEAMMREALAGMAQSLGPDHWRVANARLNLGELLMLAGRRDEALAEVQAAHAVLLAALGAEHYRTLRASGMLAELQATPGALRTSP